VETIRVQRIHHNTHANNTNEHTVLLWAIYCARVQYGPLQTLVNVIIYARGLYGEALVNMCDSFIHFTRSLHFVATEE